MNDHEQQLAEHLSLLRQEPRDSLLWRGTMSRFLTVLQYLPEFSKYTQAGRPSYFLDALNQTWSWVSREIHTFEPRTVSLRQDLTRWINGYLYWRIKDLAVKENEPGISLDQPYLGEEGDGTLSWIDRVDEDRNLLRHGTQSVALSGLDRYIIQIQTEETRKKILDLELYIEHDPEGKLCNSYPRNYPKCHSQLLAQRLLLQHPPDKLSEIAREFNINYQTLNSHWKAKTLPLLRNLIP
jgi:hypothetical protein